MQFNALTNTQARQLVDLRQAYEAFDSANREAERRFAGAMFWRRVGETEYLKRKTGLVEKSLGRRSPETEQLLAQFKAGRQAARERLEGLSAALDTQAALGRTVGLGRVPVLISRLFRALAEADVLGQILVVGTNALFAYEALGGVQFSADALATGDVDLLIDARRELKMVVTEPQDRTVLGLLKRLDHSFEIVREKPYRAVNRDGFMVDLIRPQPRPAWKAEPEGWHQDDLQASPIEGLQWLINAPSVTALVVDARGYPAPIVVPDPRLWLLHKAWVSHQPLREPEKKRRDADQAKAVWRLVAEALPQYPLDAAFAERLPRPLREVFDQLQPQRSPADEPPDDGDWVAPAPRW